MKTRFHVLILAISFATITGCKKYTCECTAYNKNVPEPGAHSNYTVKKKDKAKMCTNKSTQPDVNGNYTTCIIK